MEAFYFISNKSQHAINHIHTCKITVASDWCGVVCSVGVCGGGGGGVLVCVGVWGVGWCGGVWGCRVLVCVEVWGVGLCGGVGGVVYDIVFVSVTD